MSDARRGRPISRRTALGHVAAGVAGAFAAPRLARGQSSAPSAPPAGPGKRPPAFQKVIQVTTEEFNHSNIYCEIPYCSKDSRYFVYQRKNPKLTRNRYEFILVELASFKKWLLDRSVGLSGCAMRPDGVFYYLKRGRGKGLDLMKDDLRVEVGKPEKVYELAEGPWRSLGTVSEDGRYYLRSKTLDEKSTSFGIVLIDLEKGTETVIDRDPFTLNAHPQIEPGPGRWAMIQHNRGGRCRPDGSIDRLVGPEGATLYVLSLPDGKRTELPVGKPHTAPCTGHEAWIDSTGEMLLSVAASGDYSPEKGNLLGVRPDGTVRVVAKGYRFNHVGVSRCGRFFCCDDWQPPYKIVIGSIRTGRTAVVCESKTKPTRSQNTHPHAYLTPDLKWVIFNSNRSGFPHVYAASVPEGMIEGLAKG